MKRRLLQAVLGTTVLLCIDQAHAEGNVLLILADDVGAEEFRSYASEWASAATTNYGSTGITDTNANGKPDGFEDQDADGFPDGTVATPTIDSLAQSGVRFMEVWSNPACSPTRAGIYTGMYAIHSGVGAAIGPSSMVWQLPSDAKTLAEHMRDQQSQYARALFGKWHLGSNSGALPTDRGWTYFEGFLDGEVSSYYNWSKVSVNEQGIRVDTTETDYAVSVTIDDALAWIAAQQGPFWATVALNAAHSPFEAPPSYCLSGGTTGSGTIGMFHQMIECMDNEIGVLLAGIDPAVLANTTIIFAGDNGSESSTSQNFPSSRTKHTPYQGGVKVPLIVADGAVVSGQSSDNGTIGSITSPSRTISHSVHTSDIFATLAEIMGVSVQSSDSVSFVPLLGDPNASATRAYTYTDTFSYNATQLSSLKSSLSTSLSSLTTSNLTSVSKTNRKAGLRDSQYKLVLSSGAYSLYDLTKDPFEQSSLWCSSTDSSAKAASKTLLSQLRTIDSSYPSKICK